MTYAIQVLDYDGAPIFAEKGRDHALAKAIGILNAYRHKAYNCSGQLFSLGAGMASTHGQETITVDGVKMGICLTFATNASEMIADFDKRGVAGHRQWCLDLRDEMDAARDAQDATHD